MSGKGKGEIERARTDCTSNPGPRDNFPEGGECVVGIIIVIVVERFVNHRLSFGIFTVGDGGLRVEAFAYTRSRAAHS